MKPRTAVLTISVPKGTQKVHVTLSGRSSKPAPMPNKYLDWKDPPDREARRKLRLCKVPRHRRPSGRLTVTIWKPYYTPRQWVLPDPDRAPKAAPASDREINMAALLRLSGDREAASPRIRGIADEAVGAIGTGDPVEMPVEEIAEYAGGYDAARARRMREGR